MMQDGRNVIVAGNWKMYKTFSEAELFVKELLPLVQHTSAGVYLAVPFTLIEKLADLLKGTPIVIGAQNMNDASEGAFTGEIAGKMLKEAGAQFVILGHSERRRLFHETNSFINRKVRRAFKEKIRPILCIGESLQEHTEGHTKEILGAQLYECLEGCKANQIENLIVAYEPLWAVGTDQVASPDIVQEVHHFCRERIAEKWGAEVSKRVLIQYGGSVKPDNAKGLLEQPDVDGLLVGGASLCANTFSAIIATVQEV